MTNIEKLQDAIHRMHGCASSHIDSVPIEERFQDKVVWSGTVEVFRLEEHPEAVQCYSWSYRDDNDREQFVAVLDANPVVSPHSAVRGFIVSEITKKG